MNKIEELIAKHCPTGVDFFTLGEVAEMKRGTSATRRTIQEGEYPVISGGREPSFYCNQFNREGETITIAGSGAGAGYVQYWNKPIFVCDAFSIKGNDKLDTKFLYYYLANIQEEIYATKKGGGVPHVHISSIDKFLIPVPPMEVQREIVKVLDLFTELKTELQSLLKQELKARKKQYQYYRDHLLDFSSGQEVPMLTIEEVCKTITPKGKVKTKDYKLNGKYPIIDQSQEYIAGYTDEEIAFPKDEYVIFGDHTCIVKFADFSFVQGADGVKVIKANEIIIPKYLYYCMSNIYLEADYSRHWTKMKSFPIPIPSLEEQEKIVGILDKFDALCNDLSAGLPREIELREKQYQYYRDKLLTFNQK